MKFTHDRVLSSWDPVNIPWYKAFKLLGVRAVFASISFDRVYETVGAKRRDVSVQNHQAQTTSIVPKEIPTFLRTSRSSLLVPLQEGERQHYEHCQTASSADKNTKFIRNASKHKTTMAQAATPATCSRP